MKELLRKLLPRPVLHIVRDLRALEPSLRGTYLRRTLRRGRWSDKRLPPRRDGTARVVFVCWGNIYRSPMAATLLAHAVAQRGLTGVDVSSVGVNATPGRESPRDACEVAAELGLSLSAHRATKLTTDLADRADMLVVMDPLNDAIIAHRFPQAAHKIVALGAFEHGRTAGSGVIDDPYGMGIDAVRGCYRRLQRCVDGLADALRSDHGSRAEGNR